MIIVADNDSRHYRSQYYYLFADLLGMKPTLFCTFLQRKHKIENDGHYEVDTDLT